MLLLLLLFLLLWCLLLLLLLFCDGGVLTSCVISWDGVQRSSRMYGQTVQSRCQQIWNVNKSQVNLKTRLSKTTPSVSSLSPLSWFTGVLTKIYMSESSKKCIWLGEKNRTTDEADGQTRADTFSASLIASGGAFKSAGRRPWRRKLGCKKSLAVRFFPNCHVCSFPLPESKQLMLPLISSCSCKHSSTLSRGDIDVCSSSSSSSRR